MRSLLANTHFLLVIAGLSAISGVAASLFTHDFVCFSRSGAIVVAMSVIFLSQAGLIGHELRPSIKMSETGLSQLDPEHYKKLGQPVPQWLVTDLKARFAIGVLGPATGLLGTTIWGFGDLLNKLF